MGPFHYLPMATSQTIDGLLAPVDTREFAALFERYYEPLTRQVARMVECEHIAQELVQDVFLRFWSGRDALAIRGESGTYLRRAARNRALDWLRRETLHREWERASAHEVQSFYADVGTSDRESIDLGAALSLTLADMPPRRREVCRLRWLENLGPSAIAARMGLSVKTIEVHLTRGMKDLRSRVQS